MHRDSFAVQPAFSRLCSRLSRRIRFGGMQTRLRVSLLLAGFPAVVAAEFDSAEQKSAEADSCLFPVVEGDAQLYDGTVS